MIETRTIMKPVEAKCEVLFYIHGTPICWDPHFAPDPEFDYKENGAIRYFDTREEAEKAIAAAGPAGWNRQFDYSWIR